MLFNTQCYIKKMKKIEKKFFCPERESNPGPLRGEPQTSRSKTVGSTISVTKQKLLVSMSYVHMQSLVAVSPIGSEIISAGKFQFLGSSRKPTAPTKILCQNIQCPDWSQHPYKVSLRSIQQFSTRTSSFDLRNKEKIKITRTGIFLGKNEAFSSL